MNLFSVIITILAAVAAIFAVMYFQDRKDARKYESKAESLSKELNDLRCDLARRENDGVDNVTPLTKENIAEFLRREKTGDVEIIEEDNLILYAVNGTKYNIDCSRLPQQFILRKGYGGMEGSDIHWDILEQASVQTMKNLIMVKMHVTPNHGLEYLIVSTTHTIAALREDYEFLMALISDAERTLHDEYWKIMKVMHPDECVDEQQETAPSDMEDYAVKMAKISADQKKIQS